MGVFNVEISIGDSLGERWQDISATVDTGAFVSAVPASILHYLGVTRTMRDSVRLADGSRKEVDIGYTWLRLNGRQIMTYVAFNEEGSSPSAGCVDARGIMAGR